MDTNQADAHTAGDPQWCYAASLTFDVGGDLAGFSLSLRDGAGLDVYSSTMQVADISPTTSIALVDAEGNATVASRGLVDLIRVTAAADDDPTAISAASCSSCGRARACRRSRSP